MAEYIDRANIGLTDFEIIMCDGDYREALKILLQKIQDTPTADVQPVLRCKDCKEWHRNYLAIDGGKHGCELFQDFTRPDDFCSFGARMDGET